MQDIHAIAGEVFVGSGGGGGGDTGDRRLRTLHHQSQQHQALKCPRCESPNTKFCYYNNYNLAQPRHFCKSCRRYWTKGGVLRNVPVGGGCRKNKRSKQKSSAPGELTAVAASQAVTATTSVQAREVKTNSRSSSESSSLTATTTTTTAAAEAVSATSSMKPSDFFNVNEYSSIIAQNMHTEPPSNDCFDQFLPDLASGCGLFSDVDNISNMIASSDQHLSFGFSSILDQDSLWSHPQRNITERAGEISQSNSGCVFLNQTIQPDPPAPLLGRPSDNEEFGPLDWQPGSDQGLLNDQAFWSRNSQWADADHHQPGLFLP
ncbi:hypothetical protein SAY86_005967 [Trapa natans]|uniref:Dof zinc finger protein n=1 Tax=Trapa natans TaxID=22666 RepID=A0AAN7L6E2_TRANT|nr:hypothetical protein SAY86_005967 [Trapa natans]